ncbi:MAG: SUMF1/EgtB/PvdO family nonheme iron enzyme [Sulfurimonas sp.]|nr:SUMF1/EgtB/PvdO family nonheme iron enzyme [Sulfurimonas sp.]
MQKILLSLLLFGVSTFIVADDHNMQKIYITSDKSITIPRIKNKNLQNFSYDVKDKKIKAFYIAKYETTIAQYIAYKKGNGLIVEDDIDEDTLNEPKTNIDFQTAQKVCKYYGGRLPSEFEWVVASSIKLHKSKCYEHINKDAFVAYSTVSYPLHQKDKSIKCMTREDDEIEAELIGSELLDVKESYENINGTYGMLGNVWEWVDAKKENIYFKQSYKTIKGGSFANFEQKVLFDNRVSNFIKKDTKMSSVGFRCVFAN